MSVAIAIGRDPVSSTSSSEGRIRSEGCSLLETKEFHGYHITNTGEIYTKKGEKKYTWLNKGRAGLYERVQLRIEGKTKNFYVHRLVAQLFLPGWDPEFFVNHIDGNTLNNHVDNLEMGSQSYNVYDSYWKREVFLKVGRQKTKVVVKVATVHAVAENKLMEC